MMKTLFSSVSLRLIKLPLCLILAIAIVQFASLQNAKADSSPSVSNPGLISEEFQRVQDASNPLLDQPFPGQTHTSGLPASAIDSPMHTFEAVPAANAKANVADDTAADDAKDLSIAAIPEPSSWVLLSLGVGTLLAFGYILRQHGRTAQ